jgi:two-component sensor histidine kinase
VQALPMMLHEMTTNALKHGALSAKDGRLRITWAADDSTAPTTLEIGWIEKNGPTVTPPERHGFGMRLIEYTAQVDLEGGAELAFEPEGFRAKLTVPLLPT